MILTLVDNSLNKQAPCYLSNLLTINPISDQSMHSNYKVKQLIVPFTKRRTFTDKSFSVVGPNTGMNCLMNYICDLIWKVFVELSKHTYSVKHTIKILPVLLSF